MGMRADELAALKEAGGEGFAGALKAAQWKPWQVVVMSKAREYNGNRRCGRVWVRVLGPYEPGSRTGTAAPDLLPPRIQHMRGCLARLLGCFVSCRCALLYTDRLALLAPWPLPT